MIKIHGNEKDEVIYFLRLMKQESEVMYNSNNIHIIYFYMTSFLIYVFVN